MPQQAKLADILSERLPFRVKIATANELMAVARLRAMAYGKHLPALAKHLLEPEAADFEPGNEVFVAVSKLDGSMLGTIRTHSNLFKALPLEASIDLPTHMRGLRLVEATRLSVLGNLEASLVRNALFKVFFRYCLSQNVDWMLAAGRRPVDRLYDSMLWRDLDGVGKLYPMAHAAGVPHRVMCMAPAEAEPMWRAADHPLFRFAFRTEHPDLDFTGVQPLDEVSRVVDISRGIANAIARALGEPPVAPTMHELPQALPGRPKAPERPLGAASEASLGPSSQCSVAQSHSSIGSARADGIGTG